MHVNRGVYRNGNEETRNRYPIAVGLPATVPNSTSEFLVNLSESLYCACGFVTRKLEKTRRNAGLFSDFFPAVFGPYVVQTSSKSVQKGWLFVAPKVVICFKNR